MPHTDTDTTLSIESGLKKIPLFLEFDDFDTFMAEDPQGFVPGLIKDPSSMFLCTHMVCKFGFSQYEILIRFDSCDVMQEDILFGYRY